MGSIHDSHPYSIYTDPAKKSEYGVITDPVIFFTLPEFFFIIYLIRAAELLKKVDWKEQSSSSIVLWKFWNFLLGTWIQMCTVRYSLYRIQKAIQ